ncbi:HAD family hydrolase [Meridianimarinicoccus sp. MJW13]|uniref:HAD family hydrolase n=1 Tax=Meridianimarinicoccus sp. MJW13 TaxID=2720031 RepID=UPI001866DE21|nr:HAD family hydrolase [Fluviibacterium sp. MJW13]
MSLSHCGFVLATDLDGTFLGGPRRARRRLYSWIEENRDQTGLIYVTGRPIEFVSDLVRTGHPCPDVAICDVGTSVYRISRDGAAVADADLEAPIAARWNGAADRVRRALDGHPGLREQALPFRHRLSFDMDPAEVRPHSAEAVQALGLDLLISQNRDFDVLPKGVSKGPTLLRVLDSLQVASARVLTAGDTLNDLSMLASGLPGVAVGNAEPALLAALTAHPQIYCATRKGAAGILEAMAQRNLGPDA